MRTWNLLECLSLHRRCWWWHKHCRGYFCLLIWRCRL